MAISLPPLNPLKAAPPHQVSSCPTLVTSPGAGGRLYTHGLDLPQLGSHLSATAHAARSTSLDSFLSLYQALQ